MRLLAVVVAALALAGCAPRMGPGDTVSLTPVSVKTQPARDAALRADTPARRSGAGAPVTGPGSIGTTPGTLGDDTSFTGGATPWVAATPPPASYDVVAPRPVPARPASSGPGVVAFALSTTHAVGEPVYGRASPSPERAARGCARFASDDLAQAAFLNAGGPQADGQGLDPDGDGFVCGWDPEQFRRAVQ
jgi:hypothetical protein